VREIHPVLLQLAQLYPALFGDSPKPLKRGIFQDLQAAQGEALDKDGLKQALALHTRSTRYLNVVARARHAAICRAWKWKPWRPSMCCTR
jgi:sRNA-binding protein